MSSQLLETIARLARATPERPAIRAADGRALGYGELEQAVETLATKLLEYHGRCLALDMENSPEWVIADLACIAAGVVSLPLSPFFDAVQRHHAITQAGAAGVIGQGLEVAPLEIPAAVLPANTAKITFTSGTTRQPKGVCLSLQGMERVARSLLESVGEAAAEKTAAVLPLAVLLENVAGAYATLLAGGCYEVFPQALIGIAAGERPDFERLAGYLSQSAATSCILVPELLRGLMGALAAGGRRLPNMRFMAVGGSKVSPQLLNTAETLGLPVYQGYGLSECASVVSVNVPERKECDSVGTPLPHIRLTIAADGEVMIHDPAFLGYLGEEASPALYPTGDLGYVDAGGFLHITGRKKNVLITAFGRNISPEWPESELLSQPEIAQCVVFGDAAPALSALIVPSSAKWSDASLQSAVARANKQLPGYARIEHWCIVPPFTVEEKLLTGTGRPKREIILQTHHQCIEAMNQEEPHASIL